MGDHGVNSDQDGQLQQAFMKALLDDVHALEQMLEEGRFETGRRRIGAEQEMFLINDALRPASVAIEILKACNDPRLTPELARYNIEANLSPQEYGGKCLSAMEAETSELVELTRKIAREHGADVLLCGILPTLRRSDLVLENMSPSPRYAQLNRAMTRLRGGAFHCMIKGVDELDITHDNVMLESCNTSFQVHFQVDPSEFARLYNVAQLVTAPVLSAAVNSPMLLGHRLWKETRVALFQHAVDARPAAHQARGHRPRVSFGDSWVENSILEIFKEDIARFRVVLSTEQDEPPSAVLARGDVPSLKALCLHNSTVWRWNRACYGVKNNVAHLRIEHRALPAGPTILDEIANASFFFGLMSAYAHEYDDITKVMDFSDAKGNFVSAARLGLEAQFTWIDGEVHTAASLILDHLLPKARAGLELAEIDSGDIDRYLGTLEERVRSRRTGSVWMLKSLDALGGQGTREARSRTLTKAMLRRQAEGLPVHKWALAEPADTKDWRHSYQTVEQYMSTDLFTVRPDDLVDLAASVMDWEHVRHVPVEDDEGRLVGVVSHRSLLRLISRRSQDGDKPVTVSSIMKKDPITVAPSTPTLEAIALMRNSKLGCLPIVDGGKLVGIVTEHDFVAVAAQLFEEQLLDR